jgi:hypothetical protein
VIQIPPPTLTRDHGLTEADWLATLPGAVGAHPLQRPAPDGAIIQIATGTLTLNWQVAPERRIALIRMPRLVVEYRFDGVAEADRAAFMRYFDLFMQRGGG